MAPIIDFSTNIAPVLLLAVFTTFFFLVIYLIVQTFDFSGFTLLESILLVISPLLGYLLPSYYQNLVIYQVNNLYFGINYFGFLVPIFISTKILYEGRANKKKSLLGIVLLSILAYHLSVYRPGFGVYVSSFYLIPITASFLSILFNPDDLRNIAPFAYLIGSFGVLIGADLLKLDQILAYEPSMPTGLIIGGAGALDAIFLVGIFSIIIDLLLMFNDPVCRRKLKNKILLK